MRLPTLRYWRHRCRKHSRAVHFKPLQQRILHKDSLIAVELVPGAQLEIHQCCAALGYHQANVCRFTTQLSGAVGWHIQRSEYQFFIIGVDEALESFRD